MFFEKYLNPLYMKLLKENYSDKYLESINEEHFNEVYEIFELFGIDSLDDIVVRYLEIFEYDTREVIERLIKLKNELGIDYVEKIGDNLNLVKEAFGGSND